MSDASNDNVQLDQDEGDKEVTREEKQEGKELEEGKEEDPAEQAVDPVVEQVDPIKESEKKQEDDSMRQESPNEGLVESEEATQQDKKEPIHETKKTQEEHVFQEEQKESQKEEEEGEKASKQPASPQETAVDAAKKFGVGLRKNPTAFNKRPSLESEQHLPEAVAIGRRRMEAREKAAEEASSLNTEEGKEVEEGDVIVKQEEAVEQAGEQAEMDREEAPQTPAKTKPGSTDDTLLASTTSPSLYIRGLRSLEQKRRKRQEWEAHLTPSFSPTLHSQPDHHNKHKKDDAEKTPVWQRLYQSAVHKQQSQSNHVPSPGSVHSTCTTARNDGTLPVWERLYNQGKERNRRQLQMQHAMHTPTKSKSCRALLSTERVVEGEEGVEPTWKRLYQQGTLKGRHSLLPPEEESKSKKRVSPPPERMQELYRKGVQKLAGQRREEEKVEKVVGNLASPVRMEELYRRGVEKLSLQRTREQEMAAKEVEMELDPITGKPTGPRRTPRRSMTTPRKKAGGRWEGVQLEFQTVQQETVPVGHDVDSKVEDISMSMEDGVEVEPNMVEETEAEAKVQDDLGSETQGLAQVDADLAKLALEGSPTRSDLKMESNVNTEQKEADAVAIQAEESSTKSDIKDSSEEADGMTRKMDDEEASGQEHESMVTQEEGEEKEKREKDADIMILERTTTSTVTVVSEENDGFQKKVVVEEIVTTEVEKGFDLIVDQKEAMNQGEQHGPQDVTPVASGDVSPQVNQADDATRPIHLDEKEVVAESSRNTESEKEKDATEIEKQDAADAPCTDSDQESCNAKLPDVPQTSPVDAGKKDVVEEVVKKHEMGDEVVIPVPDRCDEVHASSFSNGDTKSMEDLELVVAQGCGKEIHVVEKTEGATTNMTLTE